MNSMVEIERKFLVSNIEECLSRSQASRRITQGYLSLDPARTVRVRHTDLQCHLTIKGLSNEKGDTRLEFEHSISQEEAEQLISLCVGNVIKKTRHQVPHRDHVFEVDVFEGVLSGLILAEVELISSDESIEFPHWIGKEVTGDKRFYNSQLAQSQSPPEL
jgi:CYTH domain-containing protein